MEKDAQEVLSMKLFATKSHVQNGLNGDDGQVVQQHAVVDLDQEVESVLTAAIELLARV